MTLTTGIDVGSGFVKAVLFEVEGADSRCLAKRTERIRQRDSLRLASKTHDRMIESAGVEADQIAYIATTGDAERITFSTGHFFSMTSHARGAIYLDPEARAVLDVGALQTRAIRIDGRGKVLSHRMTSQCASGSGRFLENISRYLGVILEEVGEISQQSTRPEMISTVCAVLGETDVINMVSRKIPLPDILKGIHLSMAVRLIKLLRVTQVCEGTVLMTGGLAMDTGLLAAMTESLAKQEMDFHVRSHPDSIYAGAIGAALWGAFRHAKLLQEGRQTLDLQRPASALPEGSALRVH